MPPAKWINQHIEKIVDERVAAQLVQLHSSVNTNTSIMTGIARSFDALLESTRNHTEALGHVADMVQALAVRVKDLEEAKQNAPPVS